MKKTILHRLKYAAMVLASLLALVAPVAVVLIAKWDTYTSYTYAGTLRLGTGGILAVVFVVLMLLGKLRRPRGIILAAGIFGFCWLLQALLVDLLLLSGMFLLGETVYVIFFQTALNRMREREKEERTADATASKMEEIFQKHRESGGTQ